MVLALWSSSGFSGMPMLVLTLLSLFVIGTLIAQATGIASIFGMIPRRQSPGLAPSPEAAQAPAGLFVEPTEPERAT